MGGGICQWVADNFDLNKDTKTGLDSTHVMGLITCQANTDQPPIAVPIPRTKDTAADILNSGDFGNLIKPYAVPSKSRFADLKVKLVPKIQIPIGNFECLDTLWLYSSRMNPNPPNWQGFMSKVVNGPCKCTTIVYNPMIPLNPSSDDAVYSTMSFVMAEAKMAGMCCATLTFDQPLYLKSFKIKEDNHPEFKKMYLRLGGFHQLMSFLGAGCKVMEGSGLEDLWATVYARNSLLKLFEGKAYTKILRACILTDTALHMTLLAEDASEDPPGEDNPNTDELISDATEIELESDDETPTGIEELLLLQDLTAKTDMWSELKELYNKLVNAETMTSDVAENDTFQMLLKELNDLLIQKAKS